MPHRSNSAQKLTNIFVKYPYCSTKYFLKEILKEQCKALAFESTKHGSRSVWVDPFEMGKPQNWDIGKWCTPRSDTAQCGDQVSTVCK